MRQSRRVWCERMASGLLGGFAGGLASGLVNGFVGDWAVLRAQESGKTDPWSNIPEFQMDREKIRENLRKEPKYKWNETLTRDGYQTGTIVVSRWRFGMRIEANGDEFRKIRGETIVPGRIPMEQEVFRGESDVSDGTTISFQNLTDARRMRIFGQILLDGRVLRAVQEMVVHRILWPKPTDVRELRIPRESQLPIPQRKYLKPAELIESAHPTIIAAAKRIPAEMKSFYSSSLDNSSQTGNTEHTADSGNIESVEDTKNTGNTEDSKTDWRRIEEIYDWTRRQIRYEDNRPQTPYGAAETLKKGVGDCDEITFLFVALCRSQGIPARPVQVPDHCYPEFAMVDGTGKLHWYPCQSAGTRAFGEMPDGRPIIGKGDFALTRSPISGTSKNRRNGQLRPEMVCEKISEESAIPFDPKSFDLEAYAAKARAAVGETAKQAGTTEPIPGSSEESFGE